MIKLPASYTSNCDSDSGFSMVEIAIGLIVMGLLLGLTLPVMRLYFDRVQVLKTQENQRIVHGALRTYQQTQNKHNLPCPANPNASGQNRGVADCTQRSQWGLVPYRTLGLPEKLAKDGYNRFMTYVVEHNLTRPNIDIHTIKGGNVQVYDEHGHSVLPEKTDDNFIAFALISHGPSGGGAYHPGGYKLPLVSGASKIKRFNSTNTANYQLGGEDQVYWISRTAFCSDVGPP